MLVLLILESKLPVSLIILLTVFVDFWLESKLFVFRDFGDRFLHFIIRNLHKSVFIVDKLVSQLIQLVNQFINVPHSVDFVSGNLLWTVI